MHLSLKYYICARGNKMRTYQIMRLASLFESIVQQNNIIGGFKIEKLISANNNLQNTITNKNLNSWLFIKGTNHYGIYRIYNTDVDYGILLTDWRDQGNFYIIVCNNKMNGNATLEISQEKNDNFIWKYKPMKRDGNNAHRKLQFSSEYPDCIVELAIPKSPTQIKSFIISLIELAEFRTKADNLSIS